MAMYMFKASYTSSGAKGLAGEGGVSRRDQVKKMLEDLGGKLDSFYFAFGETDVYGIGELPDNVAAAAASLTINASGAVATTIVPLITPEEMDAAAKKVVRYRPPGG